MNEEENYLIQQLIVGEMTLDEQSRLTQCMEMDFELLEYVSDIQHIIWSLDILMDMAVGMKKNSAVLTRVIETLDAESEIVVARRVHNTVNFENKRFQSKRLPAKIRGRSSPQPLRQTSTNWWASFGGFAVAAMILVAIGFAYYFTVSNSKAIPQVESLVHGVNVEILVAQGQISTPYEPYTQLRVGEHYQIQDLKINEGERLSFKLNNGSIVTLSGPTQMRIDQTVGDTIYLETGNLRAQVTPRTSPFIVQTKDAKVEVLGTVFEVSRFDERTHVGVEQGNVRVNAGNDVARELKTGEGLMVNADGSFQSAPSPTKLTQDISYANQLGVWSKGEWVADVNTPGAGGLVKSVNRPRHGTPYWIVSPVGYGSASIFYFAPQQIVEFTYRAHESGVFKLHLVPTEQVENEYGRLEYLVEVSANDIGQWKTIMIPLSEFENYQPSQYDYTACRQILLTSKTIANFEMARLKVARY